MLTKLFDADFPDPSGVWVDGMLFLLATRAHGNQEGNIQVRYAPSWEGPWEDFGDAIQATPDWGKQATEFWAPHTPMQTQPNNLYRLYYVTKPDNTDGLGIAMAESPVPYSGYVPAPKYLVSGEDYAAIDPFVLVVHGIQYLYWGSKGEPIRCRQLHENGYEFAEGSKVIDILKPGGGKFEKLIEGFFLHYDKASTTWYGFVSGNNTWEKRDYAVTVYRSKHHLGPFERLGELIEPSDEWWAPGQNSIVELPSGETYFLCHAVDPDDPYLPGTDRKLKRVPCVARIEFCEGMPSLHKI